MSEGRMRLSFGGKDNIYLDQKERATYWTIVIAMKLLWQEGKQKYSMTRLLKTAFEHRLEEHITENKLRRIIAYLITSRPRYIHVRQKGNFRIVFPSKFTVENFGFEKEAPLLDVIGGNGEL